MSDFQMTVAGAGVSLDTWLDTAPSRINPLPEHPHRLVRVGPVTGAPRFSITLDGVGLEPLDAALGGKLFIWSWVEQFSRDVIGDMPIPVVPGQTSVVQFVAGDFHFPGPGGTALGRGHYLLMAWRAGSGAVAIPFLVAA
jgi:hypothetical protein